MDTLPIEIGFGGGPGRLDAYLIRTGKDGLVEVRRFRSGDEAALFSVYYSAIHEIASRDYTPEQVDAWAPADVDREQWAERVQKIRPFVALHGDTIVGYADVQPDGYIDHFFVSGCHSRQGVGTKLMERIHEEARSLGLTELTANVSKTAEAFFARHGFHVVERRSPVRRGVTLQNAFMRKSLVGTSSHRSPGQPG